MADPRPLTREELAMFLPNLRAIRAFEKLFDLIPSEIETAQENSSDYKSDSSLGMTINNEIKSKSNQVLIWLMIE